MAVGSGIRLVRPVMIFGKPAGQTGSHSWLPVHSLSCACAATTDVSARPALDGCMSTRLPNFHSHPARIAVGASRGAEQAEPLVANTTLTFSCHISLHGVVLRFLNGANDSPYSVHHITPYIHELGPRFAARGDQVPRVPLPSPLQQGSLGPPPLRL